MNDQTRNIPTPLPTGVSLFDKVIEDGYYYVDKTLFIRDLLDKQAEVTLCTRPRRFGKTLNQRMIKAFFEDTKPIGGKDTRSLFNGLKIEAVGARYMDHQGQYPVIYLTFKDAGRDTFENSFGELRKKISEEFERHRYAAEKISANHESILFDRLASREASIDEYSTSIEFLSTCLERYHGKKTIILIDEYDVPLENSWSRGFYDEMVDFIRPLMSSALKDNERLQFAVITGCLRISKENIFTGLNNLDVMSILSEHYGEYFGFTQEDVDAMLAHYNLESKTQVIKDWYNGYLFGNVTVYNPWSVIKIMADWVVNPARHPAPYWANTSGNGIVRQLIDNADSGVKADIETLISGGVISKNIHEDITYDEVDKHSDNIWNFLFFTGYLKKVGERSDGVKIVLDLSIPNMEVQYIYETHIQKWFDEKIREKDFTRFYDALLNGDAEIVQEELNNMMLDTISYMDGKEDFYHGLILGMFNRLQYYSAKSNRETGLGRCDIIIKQLNRRNKAVIMELKQTNNDRALKNECAAALKQIEDNKYCRELMSEGYTDIVKYGIAFCGKYCEVKVGENEDGK